MTARVRNRFEGIRQLPQHALVMFHRIVAAWLIGEIDQYGHDEVEQGIARLHRALDSPDTGRIAEGRAAPLLATPTHAGGWIDPRVFVERYKTWCRLPFAMPTEDLIMAVSSPGS